MITTSEIVLITTKTHMWRKTLAIMIMTKMRKKIKTKMTITAIITTMIITKTKSITCSPSRKDMLNVFIWASHCICKTLYSRLKMFLDSKNCNNDNYNNFSNNDNNNNNDIKNYKNKTMTMKWQIHMWNWPLRHVLVFLKKSYPSQEFCSFYLIEN